MAVKIYLRKVTSPKQLGYGKYYAFADNETPIDLVGLAKHMSEHNTPFSEGTIIGILRDMVSCIRELNLNGQPVKIDNLAIFSTHIENKGGWASLADVGLSIGSEGDNIQSLRLCAQASGEFTKAELTKYGSVMLNREWRQKVQDAKQASDKPTDTQSGSQSGSHSGSGSEYLGDGD